MAKRIYFAVSGWLAPVGILALFISTLAQAVEFVPYAGKREVTLLNVESPNLIFVGFDTDAAGFMRTVRVRLPGIVVAKDTPQADVCEREAAQRAMEFTRNYLAAAKQIYIKDMRMENSADEEGISQILTNKGSLSAVLIKEGLARSNKIDPDAPWCT